MSLICDYQKLGDKEVEVCITCPRPISTINLLLSWINAEYLVRVTICERCKLDN